MPEAISPMAASTDDVKLEPKEQKAVEKTAAEKKKTSVTGEKAKVSVAGDGALLTKRKEQVEAFASLPVLSKVKPHVLQYSEQVATGVVFIETKAVPAALAAFEYAKLLWEKVEPHFSGEAGNELVPIVFGFCLCFFGGTFPLLIAAVEAFKLAGWDGMRNAITVLYGEMTVAMDAHKKDEQEDLDGDGIPDVQQITPQELGTRKVLLFLRVVNPEKFSTAAASISAGILAVLASLKLTFARAITLGATLGQVLQKQADHHILPTVKSATPEEFHKWLPVCSVWVTKIIAVWIAFMLQTIISAFHSAVRGGQMLGVNIVRYLNRLGKIDFNEDESLLDEMVGYGAAGLGFMFQMWMGFSVPFLLWLPFLPVTLLEYSLSITVSWV